jgi:hypothetical protein
MKKVIEYSVIGVEKMTTFKAVETIETAHDNNLLVCEADDIMETDDVVAAYQFLIDNGIIWVMQGTYGRMAEYLIDYGICSCSDTPCEPTMDTFLA